MRRIPRATAALASSMSVCRFSSQGVASPLVATSPLLRAIAGFIGSPRIVESMVPRRTFDDVILPAATRRGSISALTQVTGHDLIFNRWGLGERHPTGLASAFQLRWAFGYREDHLRRGDRARAWPPAAHRPLCRASSRCGWARRRRTSRQLFRLARDENAVLFFDEADALLPAGLRRWSRVPRARPTPWSTSCCRSSSRVAASSSSPPIWPRTSTRRSSGAYARTCCSRCPAPGSGSRSGACRCIPALTPVDADVNFQHARRALRATGGDIRNAVLKAALAAALEPGDDASKHPSAASRGGIREVLAGTRSWSSRCFIRTCRRRRRTHARSNKITTRSGALARGPRSASRQTARRTDRVNRGPPAFHRRRLPSRHASASDTTETRPATIPTSRPGPWVGPTLK